MNDGGLIPIYEFASRLCAAKNTHVLVVQEKCNNFLIFRLSESMLNKENTWDMKLDKHSGWPRLTYIKAPRKKFGEFFEYFENEKSSKDTQIFRFSSVRDAAKERPEDLEKHGPKLTPEEVVVDGRSLSLKTKVRQNENVSTLKTQNDMWNERPIAIFVCETTFYGGWSQSCTSLPEQGQILHAVQSKDGENVEL